MALAPQLIDQHGGLFRDRLPALTRIAGKRKRTVEIFDCFAVLLLFCKQHSIVETQERFGPALPELPCQPKRATVAVGSLQIANPMLGGREMRERASQERRILQHFSRFHGASVVIERGGEITLILRDLAHAPMQLRDRCAIVSLAGELKRLAEECGRLSALARRIRHLTEEGQESNLLTGQPSRRASSSARVKLSRARVVWPAFC